MSQSKETKVFILGAGCSVDCGFPLGSGFQTALEDFLKEIPNGCPRIKKSIDATVELLRKLPGIETLDQLAARIEQDLEDWKRQRGSPIVDREYGERGNLAAKQVLDAKISTSAMFVAREDKARQTRLPNYRNFITQILGGPPWAAARAADCRVLTFNYDRLFEIAFLNSFAQFNPERSCLFGEEGLNSGFLFNGDWHFVRPKACRFSFLKLHGSAGWWGRPKKGDGQRYGLSAPFRALSLEEIEKSLPKECGGPFGWQPLLAFPHERQASQEFFDERGKSSGYAWAPYIDAVWQHAASIVADAAELKVIGYSFNPIDSRYMVTKLLSKATCERIVIQNKSDVRSNLASYGELRGRLDFDPTPFGATSRAP